MVYCSDEEEMDDSHEIVMEGSDEKFEGVEDLDEIENGTSNGIIVETTIIVQI